MDKFTGKSLSLAWLFHSAYAPSISLTRGDAGDNSINQAWDEVFADVTLLFSYSLPLVALKAFVVRALMMSFQVAPPARTSIGVKELPLGRLDARSLSLQAACL